MEGSLEKNQCGTDSNNLKSSDETNSGHVEALDIFSAVKEIVQGILCQSRRASVHVNIKSAKNCQNSLRKTWFYIKISTQLNVELSVFEDKVKNRALFAVLRYMQVLENESHLCMQIPSALEGEGHQGSQQRHLFLEEDKLIVLHKVACSKQTTGTDFHLRVHQPVWQIMKECTKVHNYMAQIRLFRPKVEMTFSMKVGGAVSHTTFSVQNKRKFIQTLPSVVTDTEYFLQECELTALSETATPFTAMPVTINIWCLTPQNEYRNIPVNVSPTAFCIPVEESTFSIATLTLYGPGYLPLDMAVNCELLNELNWTKYGFAIGNADTTSNKFKVLEPSPIWLCHQHRTRSACTSVQSDQALYCWLLNELSWTKYGFAIGDADTTTNKFKGLLPCHASIALKKLTHTGQKLDSFVLPLFLLLENIDSSDRALGHHVIEKNVELILSDHRPKILGILQEILDRVLQPVLNAAKNRSLVIRSVNSICKAVTDIVSMSSSEQFRTNILQCTRVADTVELKEELNNQLTDISHRKHPGIWRGSSYDKPAERYVLNTSDTSYTDQTEERPADIVGSAGDLQGANNVSEYQVVTEDSADPNGNKLSTKVCNACGPDDQSWKAKLENNNGIVDESKEGELCGPSKSTEVPLGTTEIQVSPFQQLAVDSPGAKMDMTPEMTQIIKGMEEVSPFQELACDQKMGSDSPEVISEDPCERQMVPDSLQAGRLTQTRHNNEPGSHFDKSFVSSSWEKACLATNVSSEDLNRIHETLRSNSQKVANTDLAASVNSRCEVTVSPSDFDLLSSEEFGPTLEVVSDFIDGLFNSEKPPKEQVMENEIQRVQNNSECSQAKFHIGIDMMGEGIQNVTATECVEKETYLSKECDHCEEVSCKNHEVGCFGDVETSNKAKVKNVSDIDDWFNDVLMEAGEWLS